ncbi:plastocyanin/azurin family copper-binding protein [Natronorubrum halophilum]|uniref:plastocyanin/azurin family copper-binding protein n=1 Tax=Natronorubrum halophilum TaxID=1702106 RepID=UPI000EF65B5C|nr:plastocyanin/azurin family copper-binding protein [Natronorubrum halophilum]
MSDHPSRRHVLGITSGAIGTGLAGCLTEDDQSENDTNSDEGATNSSKDLDNESNETDSNSGNESSPDETDSTSESVAEVTMVTNDYGTHFEPHVAEIEPGETITWTLESGSHTTTAYAPANDKPQRIPDDAKAWDSGEVDDQGATFEHTFETEGVYDYYCRPHENTGMLGCVVVGDPRLDDQPGMAEPQSELPDGTHEKIRELNEMVRSGGDSGHGGHESSEDGDGSHEDGH